MKRNKKWFYLYLCGLMITLSWKPVYAAELPQAKPDKGLIIFYRLNNFKGKAIRFNLNHEEGFIGQLLSGTLIYTYVEPGEHKFWSQAISQDSIQLSVQGGKVYYVKGVVKMGVYAGRPTFTQVGEEQAKKEIATLK